MNILRRAWRVYADPATSEAVTGLRWMIPLDAARGAGDGPPTRREERRVKGLLRKRGYFGVAFVTPIDLRIRAA